MSVNVNRSVSDQFYRYKMPRLIAKVMLIFTLVVRLKLFSFIIKDCFFWGRQCEIKIFTSCRSRAKEMESRQL